MHTFQGDVSRMCGVPTKAAGLAEAGRQHSDVGAQAAVAAPGQVGAVGVPAGRLLLDPALPALEAVPALAQAKQQAARVVPQLHKHCAPDCWQEGTQRTSL